MSGRPDSESETESRLLASLSAKKQTKTPNLAGFHLVGPRQEETFTCVVGQACRVELRGHFLGPPRRGLQKPESSCTVQRDAEVYSRRRIAARWVPLALQSTFSHLSVVFPSLFSRLFPILDSNFCTVLV